MFTRRAAAIAALLVVSACSSGTGSSADGKLVIYSGRSESLVGPILTAFSTETGIEIEVKYGETSELAATILEEGDRSPADLFFAQDGGALSAVAAAGLFETLSTELLHRVPERFRSRDGSWVGTTGRIRVLAYRPDRTPEASLPARIADLTDPSWKNQVAWAPTNGSFQAFVTAMRIADGEEATRTWLQEMMANGARVYPKNDAIAEAVNNGEVALGLVNHYYPLELAEEVPDAKIASHFLPDDIGGMANAAGIGILASSSEPDAVKLVEYLLSEAVQARFVEDSFEYALVDGVAAPDGLPSLDELELPDVPLADLQDLEGTLRLLAEVRLL